VEKTAIASSGRSVDMGGGRGGTTLQDGGKVTLGLKLEGTGYVIKYRDRAVRKKLVHRAAAGRGT